MIKFFRCSGRSAPIAINWAYMRAASSNFWSCMASWAFFRQVFILGTQPEDGVGLVQFAPPRAGETASLFFTSASSGKFAAQLPEKGSRLVEALHFQRQLGTQAQILRIRVLLQQGVRLLQLFLGAQGNGQLFPAPGRQLRINLHAQQVAQR